MRTILLAGNWKMHLGPAEATAFAREFLAGLPSQVPLDLLLCAPTPSLPALATALKGSTVKTGGQNCHWEPRGAFTGESAAAMLREVGCSHVILGHSERRQLFGETDETVRLKVGAVLEAGLVPVVCIGETLAQREQGRTEAVLDRQVRAALWDLTAEQVAGLVLAYEPVWAIGTGLTATPRQADDAHRFIRSLAASLAGTEAAEAVRILYGGSMKPANAAELVALPDVDGGLVGGASLKAEMFLELVRVCS